MGAILAKLWSDPDYFRKAVTLFLGLAVVLLPILPLGDLGAVGYWLGKLGLPVVVAIGATGRGSGLTADEAERLRRLLGSSALVLLLGLLIGAGPALASHNITTENDTVTATPGIIGENVGRCLLDIENDVSSTQVVSCGPTKQGSSSWWPLTAGQTHTFGILVRGNCTAQEAISCVVPLPTPQTVHVSQEGEMPDLTPSATATSVNTATPTTASTATATGTATAVNTNTATNTPKATKTATGTQTPTNTGTPATPTNTPTPL